MDVANLTPTAGASKNSETNGRPRPQAALFEAAVGAATGTLRATTPRPVPGAQATGDRIERSDELSQQVARLKARLDQQTTLSKERVEQFQRDLSQGLDASHDTLVRAALGILHGELFFD